MDTGGSWDFTTCQTSLLGDLRASERPYFRSKVHGIWEMTPEVDLWFPHTHRQNNRSFCCCWERRLSCSSCSALAPVPDDLFCCESHLITLYDKMVQNGPHLGHHCDSTFCTKWPHWCATGKDEKVGYEESRHLPNHTSDLPKTSSIKAKSRAPQELGEKSRVLAILPMPDVTSMRNVETESNHWHIPSPSYAPHPAMSPARTATQLDNKNQIHRKGAKTLER